MKCFKCGAEIPEDSAFCPNCGKPTKNVKRDYKIKKSFNLSLKGILIIIALGIWMLVLQNLGIIPVAQEISGTVEIGNHVIVYPLR